LNHAYRTYRTAHTARGCSAPSRPARSLIRGAALAVAVLWLHAPEHSIGQEDAPLRIVSLAPSMTELIFDLGFGDDLVGRSSACDFPAAAKTLPVAGDFGRPSLEPLRRLHPNWVVSTDLEKPQLFTYLQQAGIGTIQRPSEGWEDLMETALLLAESWQEGDRGRAWVTRMRERRLRLEDRVAALWAGRDRPRVLVEVWGTPLTTAGKDSFMNDLITMAGGVPLGADLPGSYVRVSTEWVLRENPDVILLLHHGGQAQVARRPGWGGVAALREGRVIGDLDPDLLSRPGPRMILGAEQLAERLAVLWALETGKDPAPDNDEDGK